MMDSLLKEGGFWNWLKSHLAMVLTKRGIESTLEDDLNNFIQTVLTEHKINKSSICNSCTTELILSCPTKNFCVKGRQNRCVSHRSTIQGEVPGRNCAKDICHHIRDEIRKQHRQIPNWKSTDATRWGTDLVEIAKCFVPPTDRYRNAKSLKDVDFNGFLSILICKKNFGRTMPNLLSEKVNKVTKVRDMGNDIRHSGDLIVSRTNLETYIDSLISLLSDAECLAHNEAAQEAVKQLNLLKKNEVTVPVEHLNEALENAGEEIDQHLNKKDAESTTGNKTERQNKEDAMQIPRKVINDIKTEVANKETLPLTQLDTIVTIKLQALKEMKEEIKGEVVDEILRKGNANDFPQHAYRFDILSCLKYKHLCKRLRHDLVTFYRRSQGTLPISPLIIENDVPLEEVYVQPTIRSIEITNAFLDANNATSKHEICSYKDLFLSGKQPYTEVYVIAKAGVGKTSFVKKVCLTWCQAHLPVIKSAMFYQTEDLTTLKMFDLLFFISLKETDTHECHINKMIYNMLQKSMPDPNIYSRRFLDKILLEKNVLIILDGLDEWMHPENCEHMGDVIPHRRHWPNCTILTSTRPWKFYSSKIQNSQIDMLSELLEFDETKSNQLLASALKLFNRAYMTSKKVEDFGTAVSSLKVDALRSIPYIFLQLICLWFDDYTIGNSQCQIYSNTIELNLVRGKSFTDVTVTETASNESVNHPVCLSANRECLHHYQQLLRLGKLAFETLTSGRNESALIFDDHIVNKFISTDEQRFLLNKGLLSQNKDFRKVSERKSNFSFQHKTIQEYFAALYIQSSPHNPDLKKRLLTEYSTLESILQLSNMFVFLGGFSPVAYQNISDLQRSIMSTDETISRFRCRLSGRTSLPENRKCWEDVKSFQSMQTDILQEMLRNNHRDYYLYLEDVVLDNSITYKRFKTLVKIIQNNTKNIKSLSIEQSRSTKEVSDRLSKLDLPNLKLLQKIEVIATPPINYLKQLLTNSEKSLKCLDLCFANFIDGQYRTKYTKLPREIIRTVFGMDLLTSLRLNSIRLTHTGIQNLLAHINGKSEMTEIGLCHIECEDSEHSGECGVLDLSGHKNLQTLRLGTIPISTLRVNPSVLNMCYTGRLSTNVHKELDGCLSNAANLGTLRLKYLSKEQVSLYTAGSLTKLAQMKSFAIEYADFGDRKFVLTPEMRSIERVHLYEVTLTTPALEELIRSVDNLSKAVLIIIESCDIIPSCCLTYHMITNKIRKSTKYRVRFDSKKKFSFETGYANFEAKDAWVSGLFMVAGLVGAILGVLAMFLFVFQ